MLIPKTPPYRSKNHLAFVRSLPCCVMDHTCRGDVEACHVRRGADGSMGVKPSDYYTVPMCHSHHTIQHNIGELRFWYEYGGYERAGVLARAIYTATGDRRKAIEEIVKWKRGF